MLSWAGDKHPRGFGVGQRESLDRAFQRHRDAGCRGSQTAVGIKQLSNTWAAHACGRAQVSMMLVQPFANHSTQRRILLSPSPNQRTPQAGQHRRGRRVREALPSRLCRDDACSLRQSQGRQEAPGRSSPGCSDTSVAFLLRGGSGDGKRSRWHQGGNRPSAPVPRCGSLRKKQGWGPWPLRAGGAGSWGDSAASFRLPAPRSLPAAASSGPWRLPALSLDYSAPAPLPGPPGRAGMAGLLSVAMPAARLWSRRRIPCAHSVEKMGRAPQAQIT